jgi:hypothetical protein
MILFELQENFTEDSSQIKKFEIRQIASKIKSLNILLQNLMQKKIRIDLEMKRTKIKLSNLRKMSQTNLKTSLQLEDYQLPLHSDQLKSLCSQFSLDFSDIVDLDRLLDEAKRLEEDFETLYSKYILET